MILEDINKYRFPTENEIKSMVELMLAPYDENKEIPKYKQYMSDKDIDRMAKHYKVENPKTTGTTELLSHMKDWDNCEGFIDEKGIGNWSTYNPKSKWDWYEIGGRWNGSIITKDGKMTDIVRLSDIDFDEMRKQKMKSLEEYIDQITKTKGSTDIFLGSEFKTVQEYIDHRLAEPAICTAAVVDKNDWYEPAKMGWFGCTYNRKENENEWDSKFMERFVKNRDPETTVFVLVDCHI